MKGAVALLIGMVGSIVLAHPQPSTAASPVYEKQCDVEKRLDAPVVVAREDQNRIIGGVSAPDECNVVAIRYKRRDGKGPEQICTGTIVGKQLILTAGHCACGDPESYIVTMRQGAGGPFKDDGSDARIRGKPIVYDHNACTLGSERGNDLALLRLDADIRNMAAADFYGYAAGSKFLAANLREFLKIDQFVRVVGYGRTEVGGIGERRKANVSVLTPNCLDRRYRAFCRPYLEMILSDRNAAGGRGRDTCGGDSGGPVFLDLPATVCKAKSILIGVTSRAAPTGQNVAGEHCGGGGIYTVLGRTPVQDWLDSYGATQIECSP